MFYPFPACGDAALPWTLHPQEPHLGVCSTNSNHQFVCEKQGSFFAEIYFGSPWICNSASPLGSRERIQCLMFFCSLQVLPEPQCILSSCFLLCADVLVWGRWHMANPLPSPLQCDWNLPLLPGWLSCSRDFSISIRSKHY